MGFSKVCVSELQLCDSCDVLSSSFAAFHAAVAGYMTSMIFAADFTVPSFYSFFDKKFPEFPDFH